MTDTGSALSTETDAVCKMQIEKGKAKFTSEHKGKEYYFCSLSCKKEFDKDPEKYLSLYSLGK